MFFIRVVVAKNGQLVTTAHTSYMIALKSLMTLMQVCVQASSDHQERSYLHFRIEIKIINISHNDEPLVGSASPFLMLPIDLVRQIRLSVGQEAWVSFTLGIFH